MASERTYTETEQTLRAGLEASRDVLVAFAKQAGYLPAQQAYSTTATDAERALWHAVEDIDSILRDHAAQPAPSPVEFAIEQNRDHLTAARLKAEAHATRLREWSRLIGEHGSDISRWADRQFVVTELSRMAETFAKLGRGFYYHAKDPTPATTPGTCSTCVSFIPKEQSEHPIKYPFCRRFVGPDYDEVAPEKWGCTLYAPKPSPVHPVEEPSR